MSGTSGETTRHQTDNGSFRELSEYAQHSIEISRTARGEVTFSVKIYAIDPDEAAAVAVTQFEALQKHFYPPTPSVADKLDTRLHEVAALKG